MQCLIITPSAEGTTGLLAEFIHGALARRGWRVRIAAGDHQGSGFADHTRIGKPWIPWIIKRFFLSRYLQKESTRFSFQLCVVIGRIPFAGKLPIGTASMARLVPQGGSSWRIILDANGATSPKTLAFSRFTDDDESGFSQGKASALPDLTKPALADFLVGPEPPRPPPVARAVSATPETLALDLRVGGGETNLFHWIEQALGSVLTAQQDGKNVTHVVLPETPTEFQKTSLQWLGIPENKIEIRPRASPSPEAMKYPAGDVEFVCRQLREVFLKNADSARHADKVYVSRADAQYRKVKNEKGFCDFLSENGFSTVIPGQLSLAEQVAVFRDANFLISPHGAALILLFCCRPGTRILELMPGVAERVPFRAFARQFDLRYYRLACSWVGRQSRDRREANLQIEQSDCKLIASWLGK